MEREPKAQARRKTNALRDGSRGMVFDIKRFAVHDGPGIRTTVFLKGCSLRCVWCHNPEAISRDVEIFFHPERCIACLNCVEVCPSGAQQVTTEGERVFDRDHCDLTGLCVQPCYSGALETAGSILSVDDVVAQVREDAAFYEASGGGVTLSGGEPMLQSEFATSILRRCKAEGFHTALDTCGQVPWRSFEQALPFVDLVLYDIKQISPELHRRYTGASNGLLIENLKGLAERGAAVEIRMVIIPTINDAREHVEGAAELLAPLGNVVGIRLLSYHRLAGSKYVKLGKENTMPEEEPPTRERMLQVAQWLGQHGLEVIYPQAG
jgi:pyruvate formate lyase activating enzyme